MAVAVGISLRGICVASTAAQLAPVWSRFHVACEQSSLLFPAFEGRGGYGGSTPLLNCPRFRGNQTQRPNKTRKSYGIQGDD